MTPRKKATPKPPPKSTLDTFLEIHGKKVVAMAALISALILLKDYVVIPIVASHLPSASQNELKSVADKNIMDGKAILDQIDKLDMRQMQSIQRGQNVANQLRTLRMNDLRAEIARLKDAKDDASRTLVARDQQELDALIQEQNSAPMP